MNFLRRLIPGQMSDSLFTASFIIISGGMQDAYTYWCRDKVFANGQTGNVVLMSANLFEGNWHNTVRYMIPLLSFMLGIYIAQSVQHRYKNMQKIHWRQIIILFEILLLFGVGFIPETVNFAANAAVSFVCALQVQTFRKVRGHVYASTMCIGNMRSGIETLHAYFRTRDRAVLKKAMTYFYVILLFAAGAGIGKLIANFFGLRAIWFCCICLAVSFVIMFIKNEIT